MKKDNSEKETAEKRQFREGKIKQRTTLNKKH